MMFCHSDFRRETNGEPSGSVDKELFTSFLNPKNVFPVAVLLELVLRSVLNHQGIPISFILQILAKKTQISLTGTMLDTCTRKRHGPRAVFILASRFGGGDVWGGMAG